MDTHLRVILSVHVGLNSMTLLVLGDGGAEEAYLVPQAKGEKIGDLRPHRAERRLRRGRGSRRPPVREGRPLRPQRREDVDQPRRRGRPLPGDRLDRPGEEEEPRSLGASRRSSSSAAFEGFSSFRSRRSGGSWPATPAASRCRTSRFRSRTGWARRARASRSRCSRSTTVATPLPPARPASIRRVPRTLAAYAQTRKTFGVPIGQHQLVKEMIAQMVSDYDASRLLWLRAGWLKNEGRRNTRETSLAKWFATVASERAAADAVQIHGANGYSDEYPVGRYLRNCRRRGHLRGHARAPQAAAGRLRPRAIVRTSRVGSSCRRIRGVGRP